MAVGVGGVCRRRSGGTSWLWVLVVDVAPGTEQLQWRLERWRLALGSGGRRRGSAGRSLVRSSRWVLEEVPSGRGRKLSWTLRCSGLVSGSLAVSSVAVGRVVTKVAWTRGAGCGRSGWCSWKVCGRLKVVTVGESELPVGCVGAGVVPGKFGKACLESGNGRFVVECVEW